MTDKTPATEALLAATFDSTWMTRPRDECVALIEEYAAQARAEALDVLREYRDASDPFLWGYPMTQDEQHYAWERLKEAGVALRAILTETER